MNYQQKHWRKATKIFYKIYFWPTKGQKSLASQVDLESEV